MSRPGLNAGLLLLAAGIAVAPLLMPMADGSFKGSDDQATAAIAASAPGYRPWFAPLWTPPSGEVASLLFALQAAAGAGVIGYYIGLRQGRRRRQDETCAGD